MLQKKVCVLGPTGVGKTSLVKQYVEGIFSDKYLTSIGVKVDKKLVETDVPVQLMIWDLEGVDKFCGFNPRHLRGASGMLIVCDHTRYSSLAEALEILFLAKQHSDIPAILAINKTDLPVSQTWDPSILASHQHQFEHLIETSAKTGESVERMFTLMAKLVST
jgi:small GTP-binding protein